MKCISQWFDCDCGTPEHSVRFSYYREDPEQVVYLVTCLRPGPGFWARLVLGVKYILRIRDEEAIFEETILDRQAVACLRKFLAGVDKCWKGAIMDADGRMGADSTSCGEKPHEDSQSASI